MHEAFHTIEWYRTPLHLRKRMGRPRGPNWKPSRPRNSGRGQHRGERTGNAVLTEAIVLRIRELRATFGLGAVRISKVFADGGLTISASAIQAVIKGNNWKHVQLPPDWKSDEPESDAE